MEWGLGHASRCIPLIHHLIYNCKASVFVAASGPQQTLIKEAFPDINIVHPPAYSIKYRKNRAGTIARIALSIPLLVQQIKAEHRWLSAFLLNNPMDSVMPEK